MTQREAQILQWIAENPMISQQDLADKAGITRSSVAVHISNLMKKGHIGGKGYILSDSQYVVVVGGVNVDIGGKPSQTLVHKDSNPGQVTMTLGGVGRNIAHNMALMGVDVRMITALGDDSNAQKLTTSCIELGIDLSPSMHVTNASTSTYLFVTDEKGDMVVAVSDMAIYEQLTPDYLATKEQLLNNARLVIADTNIPTESLTWLAQVCKAPLFVDPVSTAKAVKLQHILGDIHTLKPNQMEAELLSGIKITDEASLRACAQSFLDKGMHRIFISLGSEGVYAADRTGQQVHVPCYPGKMVNTTGCGDAFMGSLGWSWLEGLGLEDSAKIGLAAAAIAMEGELTINPEMSAGALKEVVAKGNTSNLCD